MLVVIADVDGKAFSQSIIQRERAGFNQKASLSVAIRDAVAKQLQSKGAKRKLKAGNAISAMKLKWKIVENGRVIGVLGAQSSAQLLLLLLPGILGFVKQMKRKLNFGTPAVLFDLYTGAQGVTCLPSV